VGKSERKASFGRIKSLLEDSIERGLRENEWEFMNWTHLNLHKDKFFLLLCKRSLNFGFHKMRGIFESVRNNLLPSEVTLMHGDIN
jgi:hypothetical protein